MSSIPRVSPAFILFSLISLSFFASTSFAVELRLDPTKVEGPNACGECHKESVLSWKKTHHASTFKTLPRTKKAKEITKKMGLKRIKSGSDCLTCHFTSAETKQKTKPIAGISCESCHGAGKDWMDLHSDFGGKDITAENETPAHKRQRWEDAEAAGMIRPTDLYAVAQNCYSCHTVPNEKLVNVGGHPAGSKFELVRWSQGELRHNVWYSDENNEAPVERKRLMFILGKALDLEFAYRGLAKATKKANYAVAMAKRAKVASKHLASINKLIAVSELSEIIALNSQIKLKLNNETAYLTAAKKVGKLSQQFAQKYDGSQFAAIDKYLPKSKKYKGKVYHP